MALSFASLDSSALPDEIVDRIARDAHKMNFGSVAANIRTRVNVLDKAAEEGSANIREYLCGLGAREMVDKYADWVTLAYILDERTKHFVLYHHFADGSYNNYKMLVEGTIANNKRVKVSRVHHHGTSCGNILYPLQLVTGQHWPNLDINHQTVLVWRHPDQIIQMFDAVAP